MHMDIRIKSTGYELTPEVAAYLDERLRSIEKTLGLEADLARCEVEIGRDAGNQRHGEHVWFAEMLITRPGADSIRATNREENVNAAIDQAKDEVLHQLRREKKVQTSMVRKTGAALKRLMRFGAEE